MLENNKSKNVSICTFLFSSKVPLIAQPLLNSRHWINKG